jgi:hypothetical protein
VFIFLFPLKAIHLQYLTYRRFFFTLFYLMDHTGTEMTFHQGILNAGQSLLHCGRLRNDINAIYIFLHHFL